jgi:hypothetical protein
MTSTDEIIGTMRHEIWPLLETAMEGVVIKARGVLEEAEQQRVQGLADVVKERARVLAEIAKERALSLAEVDARRGELGREVEAMHKHKEAQEWQVELNIGGHKYQTSVQALRRVPHTFFDAYFSGRYAQDVCRDGSIFVDRDGEHFGHVLQYMRDGVVAVAEPGMLPSVSLLRALKREFGFYCIELCVEQAETLEQDEVAYVMGGEDDNFNGDDDGDLLLMPETLSSVERYEALSGQWSTAAAMGTERSKFGACMLVGEIYVTGGLDDDFGSLASVEKYSPSSNTWSAVLPLPAPRCFHSAVAVGSAIYVLGGVLDRGIRTASMLKFDSTQGTWSEVASMPAVRHGPAVCAVRRDIYVFGGRNAQVSVFKFDTEANVWSTLAPMPESSSDHTACVLGGLIYVVGDKKDVLRFDPGSETWSTLASTYKARSGGVCFAVGGCLYATGGFGDGKGVERYDVTSNTWGNVANMLEGRRYCGAVSTSVDQAEEKDLFDSLITKALNFV